jgi:hypothetical protein
MKVFIIGAGFTKALFPQAPLNRDLLTSLSKGATDSASYKLIQQYHTDDIEIALTKLDASSDSLEQPDSELHELRRQVEADLTKYFESYQISNDLVSNLTWLSRFVDHAVSAEDVAVSLNYDCVFEGALDCRDKWSPNGGYGILRHGLISDKDSIRSPVAVLKIHGSTSFRIAPYFNKPSSSAVNFAVNEGFFPKSGKNMHLEYGLGKGESYLIAPSYVKVPTVEIAYLMLDALKAVAKAETLIIIGCGLRRADMFLTLLVTDFLRQPRWQERRIIVLDPQAKVITSRIKEYLGVDVSSCMVPIQGCLQDSVEALIETIQNQFLNAGGEA